MRRTYFGFVAILVALLLFAVASSARSQPAEPRIALVIGNGAYAGKPHPTAVNDAGLMAEMLRNAGFDVTGVRDADEPVLRQTVRSFLDKVAAAGPNAVAFIYLSGYGVQYDSENYFAPVTARIARETDIPGQSLRISDILRPLSGMRATNVVVLDLAHAHPFAPGAPGLIPGLALMEPDPETLVAFNAAPGTIAPAEGGESGPYARALYELAAEPGAPIDQVFPRVRLRVHETGRGAVAPWHAARMTRPLVLFAPAGTPAGIAAAPAPIDPEAARMRARPLRETAPEEAYQLALERDTIPGYEEFIAAFPNHPLSSRVQRLLAERREALFWRRTLARNTPEAYWTYLRAYPRGPHAEQARRRLERLRAAVEVPSRFDMLIYDDVPPPREREYAIIEEIYPSPGMFAPPPPSWRRPPPAPIYLLPQPKPVPVRVCPPGTTGTPPNCVAVTPPPPPGPPVVTTTCPPGQTGTPPNCVPTQQLPPGPAATTCPPETTGTPPNCEAINRWRPCQPGTTGPNCIAITPPPPPAPPPVGRTCPPGTTGTPPNCVPTQQLPPGPGGVATCPPGQTGTPPNCVLLGAPPPPPAPPPIGRVNACVDGQRMVGSCQCMPPLSAVPNISFGIVCTSDPAALGSRCPIGQTGTPPNCQGTTCPPGSTGTPPNCNVVHCGAGLTGTPPNCRLPTNADTSCPTGMTGTRPNCVLPGSAATTCPPGQTGMPPNCVGPGQLPPGPAATTCPQGMTGTPPNCQPSTTATACPAGQTGTPPNCRPTSAAACVDGQNLATGCRCEAPLAPTQARVGPNTITLCAPAGTVIRPIGTTCPPGQTGTPPNCQPSAAATTCPAGQTGTPPNCRPSTTDTTCRREWDGYRWVLVPRPCTPAITATTCPAGQTGTPPNCKPATCPSGTIGTPPNCVQAQRGDVPCTDGEDLKARACVCIQPLALANVGGRQVCKSAARTTCPAGETGTPPNCKRGASAPVACPAGQTGTPPNCQPAGRTITARCPAGQVGTPPNCTAPPPARCPAGQTGTPPNCKPAIAARCPAGQTGTPPNCKAPPPARCPAGQTGTPPNCKSPPPAKCPAGQTGTPPNCRPAVAPRCPTGQTGTPPNCRPAAAAQTRPAVAPPTRPAGCPPGKRRNAAGQCV